MIGSVSAAFPVAALMTLTTFGPVNFKPMPVEAAPHGRTADDESHLSKLPPSEDKHERPWNRCGQKSLWGNGLRGGR
jgi:hypothetical protein